MPGGRKPTPAEERARRGDRGRDMPIVVGGRERPPMPPHLTPAMQEAWLYITNDLESASMLDHADGGIIEAAAVFWGRARDARQLLDAEMHKIAEAGGTPGMTQASPQGNVEHRLIAIERNSWKEFRGLADVLPLSPWGRARLGLRVKASGRSIEDDIGAPPRLRAVPEE